MALIVEDGSGVTGANSYITLADAQAFIDARGIDATLTEGLLLRAMDAMLDIVWLGVKADIDNPLAWPRSGVYDREGALLGWQVIPERIQRGQIWLAYYIQAGFDPAARSEKQVRSEGVGPLSVVYAVRAGEKDPIGYLSLPNVAASFRDFIGTRGMLDHA